MSICSTFCGPTPASISPIPDIRVSRQYLQAVENRKLRQTTANKKQLIRIIGITVLPIFILFGLNIVLVQDATSSSQAMERVRFNVEYSIRVFGGLIHNLQIERGVTALYLSSKSIEVYQNLVKRYSSTDQAITDIQKWIENDELHTYPVYFESKDNFHKYIVDFRTQLHPDITPLDRELLFYTNIIDNINQITLSDFRVDTNKVVWPKLVAYQQLVLAKDHAGIKRALGSTFFAKGGFVNFTMYTWFQRENYFEDALIETSQLYSSLIANDFVNFTGHELYESLNLLKEEIIRNDVDNIEPSWQRGDVWFSYMTEYMNLLLQIQERLAGDILMDLDEAISALNQEYIIYVTIMVTSLLLSPIIVHSITTQTKKIQNMGETLQSKMLELDQESKRAENLLNQMLPPSVARDLKLNRAVLAEYFDDVTIFFSDLVNFTVMCSRSTPMQVIEMLNTLYHTLDGLIEQFDAYKVETIGDAYMVASGVPIKNGRQHAVEIAKMSVAIRHSIHHLTIPHMGNDRYIIRIGLHTGPCAAGVVGKTMPRYCLFGDTVNTASRMESTGQADRIHMSEATYQTLVSYESYRETFSVKLRGTTLVKGKGDMTTYWLESRYPSMDPETVRQKLQLQNGDVDDEGNEGEEWKMQEQPET